MSKPTAIGQEIARLARSWTLKQCVETSKNRGPCIDEIQERYWGPNPFHVDYHTALVWLIVDDACKAFGTRNPLLKTDRADKLYSQAYLTGEPRTSQVPTLGAIAYDEVNRRTGIIAELDPRRDRLVYVFGNAPDGIYGFEGTITAFTNKLGIKFIHTDEIPVPLRTSTVYGPPAPDPGTVTARPAKVPAFLIAALAGAAGYGLYRILK